MYPIDMLVNVGSRPTLSTPSTPSTPSAPSAPSTLMTPFLLEDRRSLTAASCSPSRIHACRKGLEDDGMFIRRTLDPDLYAVSQTLLHASLFIKIKDLKLDRERPVPRGMVGGCVVVGVASLLCSAHWFYIFMHINQAGYIN